VGDAAGCRLAVLVLVSPCGGQPVVGHDDVSSGMACSGSQGIRFEPQALRGVAIEPIGDVILSLRCRADVRPANEIRMPQRPVADQIERLHIVPVGVLELPDS